MLDLQQRQRASPVRRRWRWECECRGVPVPECRGEARSAPFPHGRHWGSPTTSSEAALCPPSALTAAAGSISGGRGEVRPPQRSYCSRCPPGYSAGEGGERGRLRTAAGPCCTVPPAQHRWPVTLPRSPRLARGGPRRQVRSPVLSRAPLLPRPGTARRCCARRCGGGAGVSESGCCTKSERCPAWADKREQPEHSPCARCPSLRAGRRKQPAGCRGGAGSSGDGVPGLCSPGNLICRRRWWAGPLAHKPRQMLSSAPGSSLPAPGLPAHGQGLANIPPARLGAGCLDPAPS